MGTQNTPQNQTSEEQLHTLHNLIEMHMATGLRLASLMDIRAQAQETGVHIIAPITLQNRINNLVDIRKSMRSDISCIKNLMIAKIEKLVQPHLTDLETLEHSL